MLVEAGAILQTTTNHSRKTTSSQIAKSNIPPVQGLIL
jgi:hypothetical protein